MSGVSSFASNRKRSQPRDEIDRSVYTVGQTLASVVNDPRAANQQNAFWAHDSKKDVPIPPVDPTKYPPVTRQDFQRYVKVVHGTYERFMQDRGRLALHDHHPHHQGYAEDATGDHRSRLG